METIPFIYFTVLSTLMWRRHKRFDVCVYMSLLYAFTSFCGMILANSDSLLGDAGVLYDPYDIELNFIPTISYCIFVTLTILPFTLVYKKSLKKITAFNPMAIYLVSWLLIVVSLINFYLVADSTLDILSGNLEAVREAHYKGLATPAQIKAESMPRVLGYLYYLNLSTILALPLFFYYLATEQKSWWFKALLLFASLSVPLAGVQAADRTEITLYAMMLLYCITFYWSIFSRKTKKLIKMAAVPVVALGLVYVVAVTAARFSEKSQGAGGGALQYAGQGYVNFCYFWEHANPNYLTAEREFPLITHTLYGIDSTPERRAERDGQHGFSISVFPTYLGELYLDLSFAGMAIWVLFYFLGGMLLIKQRMRQELDVSEVILLFLLAVVPIFGIFYYKFYTRFYTYMFVIASMVYILSMSRKKRCRDTVGDGLPDEA